MFMPCARVRTKICALFQHEVGAVLTWKFHVHYALNLNNYLNTDGGKKQKRSQFHLNFPLAETESKMKSHMIIK